MTRPIQLILDGSAVAAYPSVHVTEPISEVYYEDAAVAVPVAALVLAGAGAKDNTRIRELLEEPGVVVLDLTADRWEQVAAALGVVRGDVAAAHALIIAHEADCEILTGTPALYAGLGDDPPIIELG